MTISKLDVRYEDIALLEMTPLDLCSLFFKLSSFLPLDHPTLPALVPVRCFSSPSHPARLPPPPILVSEVPFSQQA